MQTYSTNKIELYSSLQAQGTAEHMGCGLYLENNYQVVPNNQNTQRLWRIHSRNISNYHYGSPGYFSVKDGGTFGVSGCVKSEGRQIGSSLEDAECRSGSSPLAGREYIVALIQDNKPHTLLHNKECQHCFSEAYSWLVIFQNQSEKMLLQQNLVATGSVLDRNLAPV